MVDYFEFDRDLPDDKHLVLFYGLFDIVINDQYYAQVLNMLDFDLNKFVALHLLYKRYYDLLHFFEFYLNSWMMYLQRYIEFLVILNHIMGLSLFDIDIIFYFGHRPVQLE